LGISAPTPSVRQRTDGADRREGLKRSPPGEGRAIGNDGLPGPGPRNAQEQQGPDVRSMWEVTIMSTSSEYGLFDLVYRPIEGDVALSFACDSLGQVDLDALDHLAMADYLLARTLVGRCFHKGMVRPRLPD
jgi:hypothetical protein